VHFASLGTGPAVVFLHPSPFSWRYFQDAAPLVAAAGLRFIGVDTMGYGDSARPDPPFQTIAQFAGQVIALLEGLKLEAPTLLGHQTGSVIANEAAAERPDLLGKLVLSELFNWNRPDRRALHEARHRFYAAEPDGSHLQKIWEHHAPYALKTGGIELAQRMFLDMVKVNDGEPPSDPPGAMGWDGAAPYAMTRYETWDRTPLITTRTLVLNGETSDLRRAQERILQMLPNAVGAMVPGCAYGGPLENVGPWTQTVVDFVKS
jgi:pimeloyl-ACP methyl ester carboxylesterase